MAKGRFYAGGGQGGDVLNQVDNFIEGRPAQGDGSDSGKPSMLQGVLWAARDAILGKPKVDDVRTMDTTPNSVAQQEEILMDGVGDGTKPKKGNGVLDVALRVLGGMF